MIFQLIILKSFERYLTIKFDLPLISSRRNPLVRRLKSFSNDKERDADSFLLLEGTHLLQEALKIGCIPEEIIATEKWLKKYSELLDLESITVRLKLVTLPVLEAALTTVSPDGVASLVPYSSLPTPKSEPNFILALDRLQDPGNVGTLFRTALAAEVDSIWLALGAYPLGQKVLRASAGAVLQMPFERFGISEQQAIDLLIENLHIAVKKGFQVVATYLCEDSRQVDVIPYWELDWIKSTVLVLGNEGNGIHPKVRECCTHAVTLPHSKVVESLNVAAAAAPLLLERRRAKMTSYLKQER